MLEYGCRKSCLKGQHIWLQDVLDISLSCNRDAYYTKRSLIVVSDGCPHHPTGGSGRVPFYNIAGIEVHLSAVVLSKDHCKPLNRSGIRRGKQYAANPQLFTSGIHGNTANCGWLLKTRPVMSVRSSIPPQTNRLKIAYRCMNGGRGFCPCLAFNQTIFPSSGPPISS